MVMAGLGTRDSRMAPAVVPMNRNPSSSYAAVRSRVDAVRARFLPLQNRMAYDNELFRLADFDGEDGYDDHFREKKYRTYRTNEAKVFANKIIRHGVKATLSFKVPIERENEQQRVANQAAKDFLMSAIKMADRRLLGMVKSRLQSQLSFYSTLRGWYAGRVLLRTNERNETVVDITPWDPINVIWDVGPSAPLWVCHLSYQTWSQIVTNHPGVKKRLSPDELESNDLIMVYDYYDSEHNTVFTDSHEIKSRMRHGASEIPVFIGHASVESDMATTEYDEGMEHVGESCYEAVRDLYPSLNFVLSARKQKVAQSMKQPIKVRSRDGKKSLKGDPYVGGSEIQMAEGDDVEPMQFQEMAGDTDIFLQHLVGEIQRGSLPHTSYGDTPFQLSGFAITTLRQGLEDKVIPTTDAMRDAYQQIADKLLKQFSSGFYPSIKMPGQWDDQAIQLIRQSDPVEVKLSPHLPEDKAVQYQTALAARQGDIPIVSDSHIRADLLGVDDEEGMQDVINAEAGARLLPTALMRSMFEALMNRGQQELAQEYLQKYIMEKTKEAAEAQMLMMQAQQMGMSGMGGGGMPGMGGMPPGAPGQVPPGANQMGGGNQLNGGGMPDISQALVPQEALGQGPPAVRPQDGSFLPPGTPRPGAQNDVSGASVVP